RRCGSCRPTRSSPAPPSAVVRPCSDSRPAIRSRLPVGTHGYSRWSSHPSKGRPPMFDGHFRTSVEKAIKPVGANLRRTGITPDHLTVLGILMSTAAAVTIGAGYLRFGLVMLALAGIPDLLDGAVAKASGMAST